MKRTFIKEAYFGKTAMIVDLEKLTVTNINNKRKNSYCITLNSLENANSFIEILKQEDYKETEFLNKSEFSVKEISDIRRKRAEDDGVFYAEEQEEEIKK